MNNHIVPRGSEPPVLTRRNILDELRKQLDEYDWVWLQSNFEDKERLINVIMNSDRPHEMLAFLASRFTAQTGPELSISFTKRLKKWQKEFNRTHGIDDSLITKIRNLFS